MRFLRTSTRSLISLGVIAAAVVACSGQAPDAPGKGGSKSTGTGTGTGNNGTATGSGGAGPGTTTTGSGGGGGPIVGSGGTIGIDPGNPDAGGGGGLTADASCSAEPVRGEKRQVDLYIMMDNSGSMEGTDPGQTASRWELLRTALPQFLNDPANAGMMVGLDFFPEPGMGGGGNNNASCVVADYSNTNVPIAMLPGAANAQIDALMAAVNGRMTGGSTPTVPALTGALTVARDWQMTHPDRSLNVVFMTDGEPQGCTGNNINAASNVARMFAAGTPPINTYVLGIGTNLQNLNAIAQAGGTQMAYLVDMGGAQALVAALAAIRKSTLSCDYKIPTSDGGLDLAKINVKTRVGPTAMPVEISQVMNAAACGTGEGWFFDNPAAPTKITLCPGSCGPLQITDGSELNVLIGCPTKIRPPPM